MNYVSLSAQNTTNALLFGTRWGAGVDMTAITYSFPGLNSIWADYTNPGEPYQGFASLATDEQQAVRNTLLAWSSVANLSFTEVADDAGGNGILRIGYTTLGMNASQMGYAYAPNDTPQGGDVWLNAQLKDSLYASFTPASLSSYVILHELGHALGLKHPHSDSIINDATLNTLDDSLFNSVMSYYAWPGVVLTQTNIDRLPTTLMALDIDALHALYGANTTHASGDDLYLYDGEGRYLETIYDTGGSDTIQVTGSRNAEIDLRADEWSKLGVAVQINGGNIQSADTVRIYRTTLIENAIGGGGNDMLIGNDADNWLIGNAGDDTLIGHGGNDTLTGGMGADTFVLAPNGMGNITDFNAGDGDKLVIDGGAGLAGATGIAIGASATVDMRNGADRSELWIDPDGAAGAAEPYAIANLGSTLTNTPLLVAQANSTWSVDLGGTANPGVLGFALSPGMSNLAPTFRVGDGIVITDMGSGASTDNAQDVILQSDGKIVVAGFAGNAQDYDFALTRYNIDGSLDTSFSGDGKVTTAIGSGNDNGLNAAVQTDGKILVAGYGLVGADTDFAVARYNTDGTLDTGFSGDGIATANFVNSNTTYPLITSSGSDYGQDIVVQPDGKIVVAGSTLFENYSYRYDPYYPYYSSYYPYPYGYHYYTHYDYDVAVTRFNADGSLDTSFSTDGRLTYAYSYGDEQIYSVALDANNGILVAGDFHEWNGVLYDHNLALLRYDASGNLDTTFSSNAYAAFASVSYDEYGYSIAVQADGNILVAGARSDSFHTHLDFALFRFNADGTADTSFGTGGKVTTAIGTGNEAGQDVVVQANDKILVAGTTQNGSYYDFALVRYNADGSLDTSFSGDGKLTTGFAVTLDSRKSVTVQPDGKILVAGYGWNGNNTDFALVRYNVDGSLDYSFDGANTLDGEPVFTEDGMAVVLDDNVKIYDPELEVIGNYAGATLTLARNGGADTQDFFVAAGVLLAPLVEGSDLIVSGAIIGTVTQNSSGVLMLTFGANATSALVNQAMQSIAYHNVSDTPPATAQIDWTFADGNAGTQGSGGVLSATGSSTVRIIPADDAAPSFFGTDIQNDTYEGTAVGDRIYGKGGNDTLAGHGGADLLDGGNGNDVLDGGPGNDTLSGGQGTDFLEGGAGDDIVFGGDGIDFLNRSTGHGNDTLHGGADGDWFYFGASQSAGSATETVSASGDTGDDWFLVDIGNSPSMNLGAIEIAGGAGQDIYIHVAGYATGGAFDPNSIPELTAVSLPALVVTDFTPGAGGDRIALSFLLEISASSANGYSGGNPFNAALGYFRLTESAGNNTLLEWDINGGGNSFQTVMVIQGVAKNLLTADNFFERCSPDGLPAGTSITGEMLIGDINSFYGLLYGLSVSPDDALTGGYADDYIWGYSGNDTLNGYAGNDWLYGGEGDDVIRGWAGNDTLDGEGGNDILYGNRGDDIVNGGAGNDLLEHGAGAGNDTLSGGTGDDTFNVACNDSELVRVYGDDGSDWIWVSIAGGMSTEKIIWATGGAGQDYYAYLSGSGARPGLVVTDFATGAGGDVVYVEPLLDMSAHGANGYTGGNPFDASLGYLRLSDSAGNTLLEWDVDGVQNGASFTTVMVMEGKSAADFTADNFFGGITPNGDETAGLIQQGTAGGDSFFGGYAGDRFEGLGGDDILLGFTGADQLDGGDGNDVIVGFSGEDTLLGGMGNDALWGGMNNDSVSGGDGDDELYYLYGEANDTLAGGAGNDKIWLVAGDWESDGASISVFGDAGEDTVGIDLGKTGASTIAIVAAGGTERDEYGWGYSGNNAKADGIVDVPSLIITDFVAGAGGDCFDVAALLEVSALSQAISANPAAQSSSTAPSIASIPSSSLTSGSTSYTGGNPFTAGYLRFEQSVNDTLFQWDRDGAIGSSYGFQTLAVLQGIQPGAVNAHNFKSVVSNGTDGDDLLWGGLGADSLSGGAGNDILDGNLGPDTMAGGTGGDTYYVDDEGDVVIEVSNTQALTLAMDFGGEDKQSIGLGSAIDTVIASINHLLENYVENLTLKAGSGNISGTGNTIENVILGNEGDNTLNGGLGNDTLEGGSGTDTAQYGGNRWNYTITAIIGGYTIADSVSNRDGTDTLYSIEKLQFADVTMNLGSNNAPTSSVTISGTATQGQTLTAANTLADIDGLGTISYQWKADGIDISGAIASTYTLTEAQVGKTINVAANYTDGYGTAESVTSSATTAVANVNDAPTGGVTITGIATQGQTLTAANTLADADGLGSISYQWKADGTNISGATGSTFVLAEAQVGKVITVVANYTDGHGTAEAVISSATTAVANVNDAPTGSVTISGTVTQGQTLTAANTLADIDGLGTITYQWKADGTSISGATGSTYVLTEAQVGKTITAVASYTDGHGTAESVTSSAATAVANVNDTPTGTVSITGTATQGQTLTAANTLADIDGLGTIAYQWKADDTNITGATSNTYLLTQAEVGKAISVTASYTDGHGTPEAITSSSVNVSAPPATSSTTTSRYTLLGTGANLMDFYLPYGNLSLDGQNIVFKGNSGIDAVYVGNAAGLSFDFTQAGLSTDQIYLSGNWADYSRSYSGSVVTLIRTNGGSETIKTISGDSLIFADGTVPVLSALNYLKGTAAEPVPAGATSTAFPMTVAGTLNNTVRAVVQDASGETIALNRPGVAMIAKGGSGVDVVYVTAGANLDGTQLGLSQDKLYLTGNWADYSGTYAGSVVTLTRPVGTDTETVKFLGGSTTAYDSIVFADGTANSIDILNYLKATAAAPTLNTTEVTPLGTGDIVTGTTAADTMNGTAVGDTIYGNGGADIINGGAGNDTIVITDTGTAATNSATVLLTSTANGTDTVIGFSAAAVANGGDVLDFSAIANLTDVVATGQTLMTDFTAGNVFIFDSTPITITEAAIAIATDVSVIATDGYIVLADSANHNAVTVYYSADLAANGTETALVILSGVNINNLTAGNFLV